MRPTLLLAYQYGQLQRSRSDSERRSCVHFSNHSLAQTGEPTEPFNSGFPESLAHCRWSLRVSLSDRTNVVFVIREVL